VASSEVASIYCQTLGRGVTRSKRRAMQWVRKAAELGDTGACSELAKFMYGDRPYAREIGHVVEAAGVATPARVTEGHDVPPDVLTSVLYWLWRGSHDPRAKLAVFLRTALEGATYCRNEGCEIVGHLKDFKVCPQCKNARYCGAVCQKQDWNAGGHKATCGTNSSQVR